MSEKKCLCCDKLLRGRADKKFCDDACRNTYNNRQNSDSTNFIRNTNNTLRKNRRILHHFAPGGKSKVSRSDLLSEGFDFNFHTSIRQSKNGSTYFYCYDYGFLALENDLFLIVRM